MLPWRVLLSPSSLSDPDLNLDHVQGLPRRKSLTATDHVQGLPCSKSLTATSTPYPSVIYIYVLLGALPPVCYPSDPLDIFPH